MNARSSMRFATTFALLLYVSATACLFDPPPGPPPPPPPPPPPGRTPQEVLTNLVTAYTHRNIENYADVLAANYKFVPALGDPDVTFPFLTKDDDLGSTRRMFDNVETITMRFTYDEDQPAPPSDLIDYPADEGYVMIIVQGVFIDILTHEIVGGEPLTRRVPGYPAKFVFQRTSISPPRYAISAIFDQAGTGGRVASTSL